MDIQGILSTRDIDVLAEALKAGRENKELRLQQENQKKLLEQIEDDRNKKIDRNYVMKNKLGALAQVPIVQNIDSQNRLIEFAHECISEQASRVQGYYFFTEINMNQFIKEVLLAYYVGNYKRLEHSWEIMDSIDFLDLYYANKIYFNSFNAHELFFIVNSYNRDYKNKKHKTLYRAMNTIIGERKTIRKRTFVLSLTHDVGSDKDAEHGFGISMFPIKDKIKEVLEAKANGKNPW